MYLHTISLNDSLEEREGKRFVEGAQWGQNKKAWEGKDGEEEKTVEKDWNKTRMEG